MQKKLLVLFISLSLLGVITLGYNTYFDKNEDIINNIENNNNSNSLAIMVEGTSGYEVWSQNTWPTDGYEFNDVLSKCENGSQISFQDGSVIIKGNVSDKCYVYFDKFIPPKNLKEACPAGGNLNDCIKTLYSKNSNYNETGLYYHDAEGTITPNGAQDDSYRYAGDNPNNFVCLGDIQEDGSCGNVQNLYRIIGMFPFSSDGVQQTSYSEGMEYRIKLIKSEYITEQELKGTNGTGDGSTLSVNTQYIENPRVTKTTEIHGFYWNTNPYSNKDNWYNLWEYGEQKATLNIALNGTYLTNLENKIGSNKIAYTKWHIGGYNQYELTAKEMFDAEMGTKSEGSYPAPQTTSQAKIGLMYVSDYGYAAENVNNLWTKTLGNGYNSDDNRQNNWMYNGVYEWTISRDSGHSSHAFLVNSLGSVSYYSSVLSNPFGVRPVFYLNSVTNLKSGESADGSQAHPYMVE